MEFSVIVDPGSGRALHRGTKAVLRVLAQGPLARCSAGDRVIVREAGVPGRSANGVELATDLARADYMAFPDGWRQHRDGSGWQGVIPRDAEEKWVSALRMPDWACRTRLDVLAVTASRVQEVRVAEMRAEGLRRVLGCLWWCWPRPNPIAGLSARGAYARLWTITHPTPGVRWADNPQTLALTLRRQP
jgi:hypothetical protein